MELALDLLLHSGQHIAVDIVDEVERRQQRQRNRRAGDRFVRSSRLHRVAHRLSIAGLACFKQADSLRACF